MAMKESVAISFCPDVTHSCATTNAAFGWISPEKKKVFHFISREDSSHHAGEPENSHGAKWAPGQRLLWSNYKLIKKKTNDKDVNLSFPLIPPLFFPLFSHFFHSLLSSSPPDQEDLSLSHILTITTGRLSPPWEYEAAAVTSVYLLTSALVGVVVGGDRGNSGALCYWDWLRLCGPA